MTDRFAALVGLKLPQEEPETLKGDSAWKNFVASLYRFGRGVEDAFRLIEQRGTWTPADASGASLSFSTAAGTWVRIGHIVIAQCAVVYPATGSGADAAISGLPFASGPTSYAVALGYSTDNNGTTAALLPPSSSTVLLTLAAGGASKTNAQFSGDTVAFTLVYETP